MHVNNLFFNWVVNQLLFKQNNYKFSPSIFVIFLFLTIGNLSPNLWKLFEELLHFEDLV
jgi:hypothetical protein